MFADRHFTAIDIFKTFVIIVLLLATMIFGAGYVYVNQAGGLRRLLESELSRMVGNGAASVGDARLNFSLSRRPLQLAQHTFFAQHHWSLQSTWLLLLRSRLYRRL